MGKWEEKRKTIKGRKDEVKVQNVLSYVCDVFYVCMNTMLE